VTRHRAALACVLLVATAGCAGGIGASGDQTATTTTTAPTQTTAGGETATATPATTAESAAQLAPGVTAGGVVDARALADAHRNALEGASFVRQSAATRTNESATSARNQTFAVENESAWRLTTTGDGTAVALGVTNGTYDLYADGQRALWQLRNDAAAAGNTSYGLRSLTAQGDQVVIPPAQVFENNLRGLYDRDLVYSLAANADGVEAVDDGSEAAVELSGSASDPPTAFARTGSVSFTMTVTGDGLVTGLELSYESGDATAEHTVTFDADVADPVEEPEWYGTALNETAANGTDA